MSTRMSSLQYGLMGLFNSNHGHMPIDTLAQVKQTTLRSFLINGWLEPTSESTLALTRKGREAIYDYDNANILRKASNAPMTAYLDVVLKRQKRQSRKVIPIRKRANAA